MKLFARRRGRLLFGAVIFVLGCFPALIPGSYAANGAPVTGARFAHEIQERVSRAGREPSFARTPVTVIVEADAATDVSTPIKTGGGVLRHRWQRLNEVSIPAGKLGSLISLLPTTSLVRLPYPHEAASVTGQGVALTGAADMQALGQAGAGVTIGVIDLQFSNYTNAQASGDLPANLVITDYTGTGTAGGTHGTNVAEIVYDMAPGANLRLAKIASETQLSQAVDDMIAAGAKVIVHSVAWFNAAFYDGTGPLCDIANRAETNGVQWVNAAGNYRTAHYLGTFTDANADLRHEFAVNQNYDTFYLGAGGSVGLYLNWDAYPSTTIDYDLYLYSGNPDSGGTLVASSTNKQSGKGTAWFPYPYESITYTAASAGTFYVVVRKATSSTSNVRFSLFTSGPALSVNTTASSLTQPADCPYALGAGAANLSDVPESFSSEGPTTDGRNKPEITGPDGVQTSLTTTFYGTSASTPHVGGAVALLMSQNPTMTLSQIRWLLTSTSKDLNTVGFDYRTGSGRISLDADGDGFNHDTDNCRLVYNPDQADMDHDGIGDVCDDDIDGDGLTNAQETALGTDPRNPDTDGDGLTDAQEVNIYGTNPLVQDTDGDGLIDGQEVNVYGTNPNISNKGDLAPKGAPDNTVNAADLLVLLRFVEGLEVPTSRDNILGDLNGDGVLDVRDVLLLEQRLGFH